MQAQEHVVLLDSNNRPSGIHLKATVHHDQTPFHLAFSCYIINAQQQILLTRRALGKVAWPGVWTNSVCGHPAPNETLEQAVARRAQFELGMTITDLCLLHPEFSYRAKDANGIVEHEFCPVFMAMTDVLPDANPDEVMDTRWVSLSALLAGVSNTPFAFSPWMVEQLATTQVRDGISQAQLNRPASEYYA